MRQTTVARLFLCVGLVAWVASCRGDEAQSPAGGASTLIINELVALNQAGLKDEDGDTSDWIELKNVGPESVNLSGWFLTDNAEVLDQWALPDVELAPGAFLVVFASGKDRRTSSAQLHTNFKLKSSGEYLALTRRTDRLEVVTEFSPSYGAQRADVAWGTHEEAGYHFLSPPTPWLPNSTSQVVPEPAQVISFSEPAGLHFGPITVSISGDGILHDPRPGSRPTIGSPVVDG
ncbi:MAG: lamin tail domain-containing protein, partial [Myxococcota bacterium]|nr:lamin tail domain-containing protein [Myxococcota bacterium]